MSGFWIAVACISVVLIIAIVLYIGKKTCDMAIKSVIARQYSTLIFSQNQREAIKKSNEGCAEWLDENSKEVEIISRDGLKLKGYEIRAKEESNTWVIAVHGYLSYCCEMVPYAKKFQEYGYNILIVDLRAHGRSQGEYIGMGWLDHYDLQLWIEKIIEEHKKCKIILYGISMGSATVAMTTGEKLPSNVKLAIADCGYSSVWDEFKIHLKKVLHLPSFPILYVGSLMSKILAGYTFQEASTIKQVKKSITPTLFIHGTKDKFVPYKMLDEIYENAICPKERLEIEGAAHAESEAINPEKYWNAIEKFIYKYL